MGVLSASMIFAGTPVEETSFADSRGPVANITRLAAMASSTQALCVISMDLVGLGLETRTST
jgi:hypothetical protein